MSQADYVVLVCDGLNDLPYVIRVATVLEVAVDSLYVSTLCHSDGSGQFGACCS